MSARNLRKGVEPTSGGETRSTIPPVSPDLLQQRCTSSSPLGGDPHLHRGHQPGAGMPSRRRHCRSTCLSAASRRRRSSLPPPSSTPSPSSPVPPSAASAPGSSCSASAPPADLLTPPSLPTSASTASSTLTSLVPRRSPAPSWLSSSASSDESGVLTVADEENHINGHNFRIPFVCGYRNLDKALCRIRKGAAMIRTKGETGTTHRHGRA